MLSTERKQGTLLMEEKQAYRLPPGQTLSMGEMNAEHLHLYALLQNFRSNTQKTVSQTLSPSFRHLWEKRKKTELTISKG